MLDEDEEEDYDLSPDEDELDELEYDSESDELDAMEDPRVKSRVTEIDDQEEENLEAAAKLENGAAKEIGKGKNKRPATDSDDEPVGLDEIIGKSLKPKEEPNGEVKLSKKQKKKLKNNAGKPVVTVSETETKIVKKDGESPSGKKVQFAKQLEQGPSNAKAKPQEVAKKVDEKEKKGGEKKQGHKNDEGKKDDAAGGKQNSGPRKVQGVSIDDKVAGKGPKAKAGSRISLRYIGKLADGKVFDGKSIAALVPARYLQVYSQQKGPAI